MEDFRRTLYWNPDVRTDGEGEAIIEFTTIRLAVKSGYPLRVSHRAVGAFPMNEGGELS